ncbi:hypothetical protein EVAR_486_1 [Eumeta japonica]|uniref:Uncharacterized protein n=1 Tax=Eumeta variegata TaxID=151549 RepID=A0A4C1SAQ0_EUMVA|nr:hypothetical protein EVAR_486_1 [Eumeta japonica]
MDLAKLQPFVRNRVAEILKKTSENTTDHISRGVDPKVINGLDMWWSDDPFGFAEGGLSPTIKVETWSHCKLHPGADCINRVADLRLQMELCAEPSCCARDRPIIVEWERDARHSAGPSLVRMLVVVYGQMKRRVMIFRPPSVPLIYRFALVRTRLRNVSKVRKPIKVRSLSLSSKIGKKLDERVDLSISEGKRTCKPPKSKLSLPRMNTRNLREITSALPVS